MHYCYCPTQDRVEIDNISGSAKSPFNHCAIGLNPISVIIAKTRISGYEVSHNKNILIYEYAFNIL